MEYSNSAAPARGAVGYRGRALGFRRTGGGGEGAKASRGKPEGARGGDADQFQAETRSLAGAQVMGAPEATERRPGWACS